MQGGFGLIKTVSAYLFLHQTAKMVLSFIKICNALSAISRVLFVLAAMVCGFFQPLPTQGNTGSDIDFVNFRKEKISRDSETLMQDAWRDVSNERYDSAAYYSLVASCYSDGLSLRDKR